MVGSAGACLRKGPAREHGLTFGHRGCAAMIDRAQSSGGSMCAIGEVFRQVGLRYGLIAPG